jgi:hypothetical protein
MMVPSFMTLRPEFSPLFKNNSIESKMSKEKKKKMKKRTAAIKMK